MSGIEDFVEDNVSGFDELAETLRKIPGLVSVAKDGNLLEIVYRDMDYELLKLATHNVGLYFQESKLKDVHCEGGHGCDNGGLEGSKREELHIIRERGFFAIFRKPVAEYSKGKFLVQDIEKYTKVLNQYSILYTQRKK